MHVFVTWGVSECSGILQLGLILDCLEFSLCAFVNKSPASHEVLYGPMDNLDSLCGSN